METAPPQIAHSAEMGLPVTYGRRAPLGARRVIGGRIGAAWDLCQTEGVMLAILCARYAVVRGLVGNARHLPFEHSRCCHGPLRPGGERHGEETRANGGNERSAFHYSIT